jgi:gentisate 1,2-dioxygenase
MDKDAVPALAAAQSLDDLYPILAETRYTAGWHKKRASLWPSPRTEFQPRHWRYRESKLAMDRAGEWIGTELAERRNLLMYNPVGDNDYATARTLVSAYQMIKPGEHARAHRHTPNALRLVLDAAPGVYTVVDGVKLPMMPGDVVLTPGWTWHSHYNEGTENAYWIDFLDVPLVHLLEPMFFEPHPNEYQQVSSEPAVSPLGFPQAWTRGELAKQSPDKNGIRRLQLQHSMPTMGLNFVQLPKGAKTETARTTASSIYAVVSGSGSAHMGATTASWRYGDVFVVPGWTPCHIEAAEDALLFQVTDEPVLRKLGLLREQQD